MTLSGRHETYVPYEDYVGKYLELVQRLKREGRVVSSVGEIMKRISEVAPESFPDAKVRWQWRHACPYTSDGIAPHPDGRAKIILGVPWDEYVESSNLGAFYLSCQLWEDLSGSNVMELSKKRIKELEKCNYSLEEAKQLGELQFFARDRLNLDSYLDVIAGINAHAKIGVLKGFSPPRSRSEKRFEKTASLRPVEINNVYNLSQNGHVFALGDLSNRSCMLVGEAKKNGKIALDRILALGQGKISPEHWDQYVKDAESLLSEH